MAQDNKPGVRLFQVDRYNELNNESKTRDGLQHHHAIQSHVAKQIFGEKFAHKTGFCIVLTDEMHAKIPHEKGNTDFNNPRSTPARQALANDLIKLRALRKTEEFQKLTPDEKQSFKSALKELSDKWKNEYQDHFPKACDRGQNNNNKSQPGGIKFAAPSPAAFAAFNSSFLQGKSIEGVAFKQDGRIGLICDDNSSSGGKDIKTDASLRAADLALALILTRDGQDITFSLDPQDRMNPDGPWLCKVYQPEILRNTKFGETLFTADYIMKQLSFGDIHNPHILSTRDLIYARGGDDKHSRHRLWIENQGVELKVINDVLVFGDVKMVVKCKPLEIDPSSSSGLRDTVEVSSRSSEFADELTQNYDRVAETVPSFRRLKELAKAITLARWLHSRGLAFDEDALWRAASDNFIRDTTKHEDLVPTLVKKYSYDNRTLTLTGGVSLYKKDTPYLSSQSPLPFEIEEARKALDTAEALAKPVTLQGEGGKRQLSAVWLPLPLAAASKDDRRAENAFENTQKLFESGKYADALRELKENVYPDSRRGMALLMAAWCACAATKVANNGVSDEAVRYLREASAHCGQDTKESETLRALTLEFAERFNNQAKQSLQKAKGVYTEGSKSLYYKNAIEAFLQAHSLLPTKREYLSNLSYAYLEIGDWDKAAQYAYWCTHVASEWPKGYIRLGNCLASSGSLHAAYGWYLEAEKRCQLPQELKEVRALCEELRRKIGQLAQEEEQDVTGGEGANTSLNLEVAGLKFTLPSTWQPSAVDTSSGKDSGVLFSFTGDNVAEPTFYFEKKRGPMPAASTDLRRGCEATATKGDKLVGDRQVRQIAGSARSCHITMMNCTAAFDWPTRKLVGQIPLSSAEYLEITFTVHKDLADYGLGIWERVLDSITAA